MKFERSEYPRPQFRREKWQSLNGEWEFEFDDNNEGIKRDLFAGKTPLNGKINVPFSYQWELSGVFDKTQHDIMWYRRKFIIGGENNGNRTLLCFNAADYETDVWINGKYALAHKGGFAPFNADISDYLNDGENVIVVRCKDTLDNTLPRGKQSWTGEPFSCFYYPNSGIWQSVWIEFFDADCIENYLLRSDIDNRMIFGEIETLYAVADEAEITLNFKQKIIKKQRFTLDGKRTQFNISLADNAFDFLGKLWSVDNPNLIYVDFILYTKGKECDRAHTRMGLRKIHIDGNGKICLNNRPLYQRLILDQGYWNKSGLTPPSAEALKHDIELAKAMGFNGARKHQKLEDPYFYYYAEELGFLTWCEMPSAYTFCEKEIVAITKEWQEILSTAKNQTSNICYVPLNESWGTRDIKTDKAQQNFAKSLYFLTKSIDGEKLVSANDGFENLEESDFLSIHDYNVKTADEFPSKYNGRYDGMHPQGYPLFSDGHKYKGQPVLFTEFGGIAFMGEQKDGSWGYGNGAKDSEDLCASLEQLMKGIATTEFQGYCYTQLTDVQQEVNGLLNADRIPKCDLNRLKTIFENK